MTNKRDNETIERLVLAIEALHAMDFHLDVGIPVLEAYTRDTPTKGLCAQCAKVAVAILRGAGTEEANEFLCDDMKKWRSQATWAAGFIERYRRK